MELKGRELLEEVIAKGFASVEDTKGQMTSFELTRTGAIEAVKRREQRKGHFISVLRGFGTTNQMRLLLEIALKKENRGHDEPRCVGSLDLNSGMLRALLFMPADALNPVLHTLNAGRMRYVVINGARLYYRQALVEHYRMESNYDPDDLPKDEG
jgi:hypothetical protein